MFTVIERFVFIMPQIHDFFEMCIRDRRSTGEVLGIAPTFGEAYYKAQEATQVKLPLGGTVLLSVRCV